MSMKYNLSRLLTFLVLIFSACNNTENNKHDLMNHGQSDSLYTCPMHPEVQQQGPGICPKCNMKLEKIMQFEAVTQLVSPNKQVLSRQATVKLNIADSGSSIQAQGYIDYDKTRNHSYSARFGGRIEKLFVRYNFQFVQKGDKIMEIYSPELNTIQEDHLFLLKSGKDSTLLDESRRKLKLLGITENQIVALERERLVNQSFEVYSPNDGFIIFNPLTEATTGVVSSQNSQMGSMNLNADNRSNKSYDNSNGQIREGQYINKGETLFNLNDLKKVWGILSVAGEMQSEFDVHDKVLLKSESTSQPIVGKILLVEKTFEDMNQNFFRVRVEMSNLNSELKINSVITAEIFISSKMGFQIPASAVYRTGLNSFVWVKTDTSQQGTGVFQLRKVVSGPVSNGMITIISGLAINEEVAKHAGYMTDSETFLYDF